MKKSQIIKSGLLRGIELSTIFPTTTDYRRWAGMNEKELKLWFRCHDIAMVLLLVFAVVCFVLALTVSLWFGVGLAIAQWGPLAVRRWVK